MATPNRYKVTAKQWKRWTADGRAMFNHLYGMMRPNQGLFLHPKTQEVPARQWNTTAWNAAWEAASVVSGSGTNAAVSES